MVYPIRWATFFEVNRVEHQKLNQTMTYAVFCVKWDTFFLVNRVEHQKLSQTTPYDAVWF